VAAKRQKKTCSAQGQREFVHDSGQAKVIAFPLEHLGGWSMFNQLLRRRDFIKLTGFVLGSIPFIGTAQARSARFLNFQIGVLQGPTNATSTVITVVLQRDLKPVFQVPGAIAMDAKRIDMGYMDFVVYQVRITGLELGVVYNLGIEDRDKGISVTREFQSLDLTNLNAKVAVISCSNHAKADLQTLMTQKLNRAAPDAIFFIGDMIYANRPTDTMMGRAAPPDKAYELYIKTFLSLDFYAQTKLIPTFSIWDDHDMGKDNADSSHPYKATMIEMFRNFYPADARIPELKLGPGMSFSLDAFGVQSIFLDGRVYATPGTLLGNSQLQWAKDQYTQSGKPCLMILGQQFFNYQSIHDSFQRYAGSEFNGFLAHMKQHRRPTIFVSGDVHYSQIERLPSTHLGYQTYEVTSSALFSSSANDLYLRGGGSQMKYYGKQNFLVLDQLQPSREHLSLRVTCVSRGNDVEFQQNLSV
jgi:alkaline phosphatase D